MNSGNGTIRRGAATEVRPPTDVEAERAALGSCLIAPDWSALDSVREALPDGAAELWLPAHKLVYAALLALRVDAGGTAAPDSVTLLAKLTELQPHHRITYDVLGDLVTSVPSHLRAHHYAELVHKAYVVRQALNIAHDIIQATAAGRSADLIVSRLRADVDSITAGKAEASTGPVLVRVADVEPRAVSWLWPGRIALGKLTLIAGDPVLGKSFVSLDIAARITSGGAWPDRPGERGLCGGVVLLSAEDDAGDTIRPRLDAAGADIERVVLLDAVTAGQRRRSFNLAEDLDALREAVRAVHECRLVIVDPVSAYMGSVDSHVNADVRSVLAPLAELAASAGVAVLAVTHLRKGDGPAVYRSMGSLAFVAAARAAWAVTKDRDDETGRRRLVLPIKNNLTADSTGLAYALEPSGQTAVVAWERDPVRVDVDDALTPPAGRRGRPADGLAEASEFLVDGLRFGPRPSRELVEEAREGVGISRRTLERARKALGVKAFRENPSGPWLLRLPAATQAASHTATTPPTREYWRSGGVENTAEKAGFSEAADATPPHRHISAEGGTPPDPAGDTPDPSDSPGDDLDDDNPDLQEGEPC